MRCPKCGSEELYVVDSRSDSDAIRRRRECEKCAQRFTTYERVELELPMVIKKDGRREPFDSHKIRGGLVKACEKRPVSVELLEKIVSSIEKRVSELYIKEIESTKIGDFIMEELKPVDKIAYVRFASVYREFTDIKQFVDTLKGLNKGETGAERKAGNS